MSFENQIKEILKARLEGTATEEELAILREWLDRSPQNRELAELLEESAENLPLLGRIYGYDEQRVWGNIRKAARRRRMRMLAHGPEIRGGRRRGGAAGRRRLVDARRRGRTARTAGLHRAADARGAGRRADPFVGRERRARSGRAADARRTGRHAPRDRRRGAGLPQGGGRAGDSDDEHRHRAGAARSSRSASRTARRYGSTPSRASSSRSASATVRAR